MAILGIRGSGDWGVDERPKNFRETILRRTPNGSAPLTALLAKLKSQPVDDPEFSWWEELQSIVRVKVDGTGASATSTTIGLTASGNMLVPGDLVLVEKADQVVYDNEMLEVSSVSSDTSVVFKRGAAGTTAAAIPADAYLTKVSPRYEEGSGAPMSVIRNPTKIFNYTQIVKTAYEITRTADKTHARTGSALTNDKKRRMTDHSTSLEHMLLFGRRSEVTGPNGKPMRTTGGVRSFLQTNVKVYTTTPTLNSFLDAVAPMFDFDIGDAGNERLGLCGNGFLMSLNKLVMNSSQVRINYDSPIELYGMKLFRLTLPQGTIYLRTHPLLNAHARWTYSAFFIEPSNLRYRYITDTTPQDNIQLPDADTKKGQWLTEAGLELWGEMTHAYVGNFLVP